MNPWQDAPHWSLEQAAASAWPSQNDSSTMVSGSRSQVAMHGAAGVSQDVPLAAFFAGIRALRFADGPDEVHRNALAKSELAR